MSAVKKPPLQWSNFKGHLHTIRNHKRLVRSLCFRAGMYKQGLLHDLSKYSPVEFWAGVRYYQNGTRSPNAAQREQLGYSLAWLHHKGRNKHHLEYWIDYDMNHIQPMAGCEMPLRYVAEMTFDRIAACKNYHGDTYTDADAWEYYNHSRGHYLLHPNTQALLEEFLLLLKEQGEEVLTQEIRKRLQEEKR